ncbi:MAG: glycoside hydrolase family 5 protein [Acetobacteraceae bacterium]
MRCWLTIGLVLLTATTTALARPPANRVDRLARGVNITGWFRFPVSYDVRALHDYLGSAAIASLRRSGFTFVRLAVDPTRLSDHPFAAAVGDAVRRLTDEHLAVIVSLHPVGWHLETDAADRDRLMAGWQRLSTLLRRTDPGLVFAELLNEPVFPGDPAGWQALQDRLLERVRSMLPDHTIVVTGHDWSSIGGLLVLQPTTDPNVVYTFHLYEPPELTSLAAYRAGLDRRALSRLPFPVTDRAACDTVADDTDTATAGVIRYYCAMGWTAGRIAERVGRAADWARTHDTVLLAGEFGATVALNGPARQNWLRAVREACEARGIGWALWGYDDVMGFAVARPPRGVPSLDRGTLEALGLTKSISERTDHEKMPPARAGGKYTGRLHVWETQGSEDPFPATQAGTLAANRRIR